MGKESTGPKRKFEVTTTSAVHANKQYIQLMLVQQWATPIAFPSAKDLSEDGHATVIVRTPTSDQTTVCKGLKQNGNEYWKLVKRLRERGVIGKSKVRLFVRIGVIWEPVNETNGMFSSGSCIMAVIEPQLKKTIAKIK
eukprot:TRINITY_DN3577_c0_g1_i5.p1 TRINITY_DN3577_c0_g1~~TRINITY_DN3577_c0_g1_i5.p1  ORF type:complete len:139 (+),score=18.45 TRINITY_DN3577_c0_g1_i5:265-681(+)